MSRQAHILRIIADGPATASEVAIELGITANLASAHLSELRRKGKLTKRTFCRPSGPRPKINLYGLAP